MIKQALVRITEIIKLCHLLSYYFPCSAVIIIVIHWSATTLKPLIDEVNDLDLGETSFLVDGSWFSRGCSLTHEVRPNIVLDIGSSLKVQTYINKTFWCQVDTFSSCCGSHTALEQLFFHMVAQIARPMSSGADKGDCAWFATVFG